MYEKILEIIRFVELINSDIIESTGEVIPSMSIEEFNEVKEFVKSQI